MLIILLLLIIIIIIISSSSSSRQQQLTDLNVLTGIFHAQDLVKFFIAVLQRKLQLRLDCISVFLYMIVFRNNVLSIQL